MMLRRLVTNRPLDVSVTMLDGESNPRAVQGSATARLVRDDGTELDAARACPAGAAPGEVILPVTASDTDRLDLIAATVTDTAGSEEVRLEVCGGHSFTISWARQEAGELVGIPDKRIVAARLMAEGAIEDECERAFTRRYRREQAWAMGDRQVMLPNGDLRAVRSVTVDGVALTTEELAALSWTDDGYISHDGSWRGKAVEVAYEYGPDHPPGDSPSAHLKLAKHLLIASIAGDRALRYIDAGENETVFSAPGVRGIVFAIPDVQGFVERYRRRRVLVA